MAERTRAGVLGAASDTSRFAHRPPRRVTWPLIEQLTEQRATLDLSQAETAELAGITPSTVTRAEAGTKFPLLDTAAAIADALGLQFVLIRTDEHLCRECRVVKNFRRFRVDRRTGRLSDYCGPCAARMPRALNAVVGLADGRAKLIERRKAHAAERQARFDERRDAGRSVAEAGEDVGIRLRTAYKYERMRLERGLAVAA